MYGIEEFTGSYVKIEAAFELKKRVEELEHEGKTFDRSAQDVKLVGEELYRHILSNIKLQARVEELEKQLEEFIQHNDQAWQIRNDLL